VSLLGVDDCSAASICKRADAMVQAGNLCVAAQVTSRNRSRLARSALGLGFSWNCVACAVAVAVPVAVRRQRRPVETLDMFDRRYRSLSGSFSMNMESCRVPECWCALVLVSVGCSSWYFVVCLAHSTSPTFMKDYQHLHCFRIININVLTSESLVSNNCASIYGCT
jgi:hypothetical protein